MAGITASTPDMPGALRACGFCLQLLLRSPWSSAFNNYTDGLTGKEGTAGRRMASAHMCARSAGPGAVTGVILHPLHSPQGKYSSPTARS